MTPQYKHESIKIILSTVSVECKWKPIICVTSRKAHVILKSVMLTPIKTNSSV